jgi:hypothetical protein
MFWNVHPYARTSSYSLTLTTVVSKKILLILSILAAGIFSAFAWMLYMQTPQFVLGEMQRGLSHTKTIRFSVDLSGGDGVVALPALSLALVGAPRETRQTHGSFSYRATTDVDLRDLGTLMRETNGRGTLTEKGNEAITGSGRFIVAGEKRALWFDRVPTTNGLVRAALEDRWLTVPQAALQVPFLRPGVSIALPARADEKIRALFRKTSFVRFEKRLPDGKEAGNETYTYAVTFRPEAFKAFVIVLATLREQRSFRDAELSQLEADLAHWQVEDMQLQIRKRDFALQEVRLSMRYQNRETQSDMPFTVTLRPLRVNQPLNISFPKEAQAIRGALTTAGVAGFSLADGRLDETLAASSTETITDGLTPAPAPIPVMKDEDEDHDGLTQTLEAFYGTDARNPDTDGDGYEDGYEVNHGFNPSGPGKLFDFLR